MSGGWSRLERGDNSMGCGMLTTTCIGGLLFITLVMALIAWLFGADLGDM